MVPTVCAAGAEIYENLLLIPVSAVNMNTLQFIYHVSVMVEDKNKTLLIHISTHIILIIVTLLTCCILLVCYSTTQVPIRCILECKQISSNFIYLLSAVLVLFGTLAVTEMSEVSETTQDNA